MATKQHQPRKGNQSKKSQRGSSVAERPAHTRQAAGSTPAPAATRKRADWDAIEPHYRAGIRALKDIGREFGVSDAAIVKHAKANDWTRNLKAKIQARADAKVSAALVSAEVSARTKATEAVRVEVESEVQARIRLAHRADIGRARGLAMKLLAELEHQTDHQGLYEQLFDALHAPDDEDGAKDRWRKLNETFQRAMSLSGRADTMKKLAETLRVLIDKEREAFGVSVGSGSDADEKEDAGAALRGFFANLYAGGARIKHVRETA